MPLPLLLLGSLALQLSHCSQEAGLLGTACTASPVCLVRAFQSTHLQVYGCVDLSGVLVGWAEESLLDSGSFTCRRLKRRGIKRAFHATMVLTDISLFMVLRSLISKLMTPGFSEGGVKNLCR